MSEQKTEQSTDLKPTTDVVKVASSLIPGDINGEWDAIKRQAVLAFNSGLLPTSIKSPEQAAIIALKGRELGIGIMRALSAIHVIDGKPCLSAELMLELVYTKHPQAKIVFLTPPDEAHLGCKATFVRPGGEPQVFQFTMEDAKRAQLTGKKNWAGYPADMCRARVIARGCRAVFPDAIGGCSLADELTHEEAEAFDPRKGGKAAALTASRVANG